MLSTDSTFKEIEVLYDTLTPFYPLTGCKKCEDFKNLRCVRGSIAFQS